MQAFPTTFYASELGNGVCSNSLALKIWQRIRPKGFSWYAVDLTILSPRQVMLTVHNMKDTFYGGIGEVIHEQKVENFTPEEEADLDRVLLSIYTKCAESDLIAEEERKFQEALLARRKEMFGV